MPTVLSKMNGFFEGPFGKMMVGNPKRKVPKFAHLRFINIIFSHFPGYFNLGALHRPVSHQAKTLERQSARKPEP